MELAADQNQLLTITEMLNVTNISQPTVVHSTHKINRIYFAISVNVPSVYFIVNYTNLIECTFYQIISYCAPNGQIMEKY